MTLTAQMRDDTRRHAAICPLALIEGVNRE
jgi:hypothetical protein